MSNLDLFSMAVRNLIKRKLRTALTVLGVVIGTASIVVMVSLGVGMNKNFESMIDQMGNITVIEVSSEAYWNDAAPKGTPMLNDAKLTELERVNGVEAVTPILRGNFQVKSGKLITWASVNGIDMSIFERLGYKVEQGRIPDKNDKNAIVAGGNVGQNFYDPKARGNMNQSEIDIMTAEIEILTTAMQTDRGKYIAKPLTATITGLMARDSMNSYEMYMDIDAVKALNAEGKALEDKYRKQQGQSAPKENTRDRGYERVLVKCKDMDSVSEAQKTIQEMGFNAWSQGEWLSSMKKMSGSLQGLLGAIGAVSLIVAAIGIANTMLMAIYERTREIGVMKVIGATISDIRRLFLTEAALIGFLGGLAGLVLSYGISYVLNNGEGLAFMDMINWNPQGMETDLSIIPVWLAVSALVFSSVIGVISGYLPARRAMSLSALEAIKTE